MITMVLNHVSKDSCRDCKLACNKYYVWVLLQEPFRIGQLQKKDKKLMHLILTDKSKATQPGGRL